MTGYHHRTSQPSSGRIDPYQAWDREEGSRAAAAPSETGPLPAARSRDRGHDTDPPPGFGHRVEKILFVAEQEAAETRRSATRESTALLERARVEADALRREGENAVETYRSEVERAADQRVTELDAREREIEWHRDSARVDAERRLAEAHREADRIVADALGEADAVRAALDEEIAERRAEVERQMAWLEESRQAARDLAQMLLAQVGEGDGRPVAAPHEPPGPQEPDPREGDREEFDSEFALEDPLRVDPSTRRAWSDPDGLTTAVPATVDDVPATRSGAELSLRAPRAHSPAVVPPAELRFAGTFGGVLGPVDEGITDSGSGDLRATGDGGDHTERLHALGGTYHDSLSHPLHRGRSA